MKFASAKQAILLIIVTCAGLYALDYYKNPQLWHHESQEMKASGKGARLALWMNHLCYRVSGRRPASLGWRSRSGSRQRNRSPSAQHAAADLHIYASLAALRMLAHAAW